MPRNVLIIAFVALASGFGQDMITPVLPGFLIALGLAKADIGLIDGLLQGATSLFRLVSGLLSDRFSDRKTFIFLGYALSAVSRPLLALTGSFLPIATLRVTDGIGKGTKDAPRDALIADSVVGDTSGRAFGFQRLIDTAGSVLGPLAAAGLLFWLTPSLVAYRTIFALAVIPGAIALGLILFGIKEPKRTTTKRRAARRALPWQYWVFTIGTAIAMLTKVNDSLFLVRAGDVGVPLAWIPVLFAGFTLLYALLSYPIGILSDKVGKLPIVASGWLVLAIVQFGFYEEKTLAPALVLFAFYGLFYALTESSGRAPIADLVATESRGTAYAIFHATVGVSLIAGGYGLGRVWDTVSPQATFAIAATGSLVGFVVIAYLATRSRAKTVDVTT